MKVVGHTKEVLEECQIIMIASMCKKNKLTRRQ